MTYDLAAIMNKAWTFHRNTMAHSGKSDFANALRFAWEWGRTYARIRNAANLIPMTRLEALQARYEALSYSDAIGTAAKMAAVSREITALKMAA